MTLVRATTAAAPRFPSTRYQGSKAKLTDWIWRQLAPLGFDSCLDAFGGTGAVAWRLRREGKQVTYNDVLRFNHQFGRALIENRGVRLDDEDVSFVLEARRGVRYPRFVQDHFAGIYYTDEENAFIDRAVTNVRALGDRYKRALAFFALCQACLVKRPYNLFHRKNLYLRLADVPRTFGNKVSWDRPFEAWFRHFAAEANAAVFDNGRRNRALNLDARAVPGRYDLVYVDTPYVSGRGQATDYFGLYHFLEGLADYDRWEERLDRASRHRRLLPPRVGATVPGRSAFAHARGVHQAFDELFARWRDAVLAVSYRRDGIPSAPELAALLRRHKRRVRVLHYGRYRYALSKARDSGELLLVAS
jgi:adenine-specific DNA-methyltransferase